LQFSRDVGHAEHAWFKHREAVMNSPDATDRARAILFARAILGLIFFMAGVWKVFQLGPLQHARRFFIEPYAQSFLPR